MDLFRGGKFAIGLFVGVFVCVVFWLYSTSCECGAQILWFCGEDQAVVLATLQFLNGLVASIAWPLTVLVLVLSFHRPVAAALSALKLKSLKAGGIEAEFVLDVAEAELSLREPDADMIEDVAPSPKILQYLRTDKRYAVLAAWIELERKLKRLAEYELPEYRQSKIDYIRPADIRRLDLSKSVIQAIGELRKARNKVAHETDPDISETDIIRYLELAADIEHYIQKKLEAKPY